MIISNLQKLIITKKIDSYSTILVILRFLIFLDLIFSKIALDGHSLFIPINTVTYYIKTYSI